MSVIVSVIVFDASYSTRRLQLTEKHIHVCNNLNSPVTCRLHNTGLSIEEVSPHVYLSQNTSVLYIHNISNILICGVGPIGLSFRLIYGYFIPSTAVERENQ